MEEKLDMLMAEIWQSKDKKLAELKHEVATAQEKDLAKKIRGS